MVSLIKWFREHFDAKASIDKSIADAVDAAVKREVARANAEFFQHANAELFKQLYASTRRTNPSTRQPVTDPLAQALREIGNLRWDVKVLGSELARRLYDPTNLESEVAEPGTIPLTSKLCVQADMNTSWLRYWCNELKMAPVYHRKVWEDCYVLQALYENGMLERGRRGLGFAVGEEPLPSYFSSRGIDVLATDLDSSDERSEAWQKTGQHASSLRQLHKGGLVEAAEFAKHCSFAYVDMNVIPKEYFGQFDFCWSVCSLEHVGSIEKGLKFIEQSVRCLKPGGMAVHTTEFNLDKSGETIDDWGTVLFRQRDMEEVANRLKEAGHQIYAIDFDPGSDPLDGFIDLPPYADAAWNVEVSKKVPHLRLSVDGFPATSIGLIIKAAG